MDGSTPKVQRLADPRRIGLLGFDGVAGLDLIGVLDAFSIAATLKSPFALYETLVVGLSDTSFVSESGLRMVPDTALSDCPPLDTIVVPGGFGLRRPEISTVIAAWLRGRETQTRRFVSICTGVYGLAASGLLEGRRATTHWRHVAHATRSFPRVIFEADAIFIKDGACYTSAGMTAGIDLALALIEEDHGPALALATARQMVVYMKRSGGQLQYSEPLQSQILGADRFADLLAKMVGDLGADWSVEAMAEATGLSPRHFARRFKTAYRTSPAAHLEILRLDEARLRLTTSRNGVSRIAHAVGFRSDDAFRRAFERRFGLTPSAYRSRFTTPDAHNSQEPDHDAALS